MAAPTIKAGDVLAGGKYRVERVLGAGGMGMVVAARHIQLGQRVALKFMLKEAMADPSNTERFAREARAAVQLQSPHTARVLDVGKLKNGEPYMVMEYLDGHDLDEVLSQNGPMQPEMAVGYLLQACEAFAEAHGLGMIHRDIKLKNLFLTKAVDGRALVKVLDFGLAKTIGGIGDVSLTSTSAVFGSPQYMSPEQMRSAKDVDSRSDIWSIGVCLYELLTGHVPFDAAGIAEICAMVLKDAVEPPSRWAQGLPPELDAVVVKCLEKDPKNRYQTVAELAYALEPWTALEGSARRILHVMQAVQKADLPTLLNPSDEEPVAQDTGVKTMAAWDSGERARATRRRLSAVAIIAAIAMFLVGSGLIGMVLLRGGKRLQSTAENVTAPPNESPAAAETAPPPEVTSVAAAAIAAEPVIPAPLPEPPVATATPTATVTAVASAKPVPAVAAAKPPPAPAVAAKPPPPRPSATQPPPRPTASAKPAAVMAAPKPSASTRPDIKNQF